MNQIPPLERIQRIMLLVRIFELSTDFYSFINMRNHSKERHPRMISDANVPSPVVEEAEDEVIFALVPYFTFR